MVQYIIEKNMRSKIYICKKDDSSFDFEMVKGKKYIIDIVDIDNTWYKKYNIYNIIDNKTNKKIGSIFSYILVDEFFINIEDLREEKLNTIFNE